MKILLSVFLAMVLVGCVTGGKTDLAAIVQVDRVASGDAASVGASFGNQLVIEAGDADSRATISISDFFTDGTRTHRYRFKATAPLDRDKADSVDIGTLSGLSAGTSATAEFGWVNWRQAREQRVDLLDRFCDDLFPQLIRGYPKGLADSLGGLHCDELSPDAVREAAKRLNDDRAKCQDPTLPPAALPTRCDLRLALPEAEVPVDLDVLLQGVTARHAALVRESTMDVGLWTVAASGNRRTIAYALPAAPADMLNEDAKGWGVTGAYTRISDSFLWSAGYSHEETHTPAGTVSICSPIEMTGSLSCSNASLGAPQEKESEIIFGEVRWVLPQRRLAISPRVEFDTDESEWALRFPVYLVRNADGALTGGFAAGWTSTQSGMDLAVFVGKKFAFFDD
jgi:hypothetical protein